MSPLLTIPCSPCVVLTFHMSESKGRMDNRVWKRSEEILSLLLGQKDEEDPTEQRWRKGISDAKIPDVRVSQHG